MLSVCVKLLLKQHTGYSLVLSQLECIPQEIKYKQTDKSSACVRFQAKLEPRDAAPSAGPVLHSQPPQTTSSVASTLANTVRIEKLSDEEDEEVDITDDLSDDGHCNNKPIKTEFCEPELLTGSGIQTETPTEEQKEADLTETKHQPCLQSLPPMSSPLCSEKTGVTELDERGDKGVSPPPKDVQAELRTNENEGQSSQSESSAQTGQLEEACDDATGKTAVFM